MNFFLLYLIDRFFYRFYSFFYHWYIDGSRFFLDQGNRSFWFAERLFGAKAAAREFLKPPLTGIFSRAGRIGIGGAFSLLSLLAFFCAYLFWVLIPIWTAGAAVVLFIKR